MSDDIPRYVRAPDTGDDRYWSDSRQFPFLLEDGHGRTDRLIHLAMKLTDHDGQPFALVATHDEAGESVIGLAVYPGDGLGLLPRHHVWDPDPSPTAAREQPAIVLSIDDLHRLSSIARALLTSLDLTTAAATAAADA